MSDFENLATEIAKAEHKRAEAQDQLDLLDVLKAKEATLRSDVRRYTARIAELRESVDDTINAGEFYEKPVEVATDVIEAKITEARKVLEKSPAERRLASMRSINKKLQQIDKLKAKGGLLDPEAEAKVKSEASLRKKLAALEAGENPESDGDVEPPQQSNQGAPAEEEQDGEGVELPSDPEERKKKIKALQKKLREIEQLKQKGGLLDKQAKAKRDSEQHLIQELAALESGKSVFVLDEAALFSAHKLELEKQVKKLQKKMAQIAELKGKTDLDADMQAKLDSAEMTGKELHDLQTDVGEMNKKERERVAARLGWQEEKSGKKKGGNK